MKRTDPTRTLLQGCQYRPSWLAPTPVRYTLPKLCGAYGLQGAYRNRVPEGSAHERDLDEADNPSTAG